MKKVISELELADSFIHPITHQQMYFNNEKQLCNENGEVLFRNNQGSYDFVSSSTDERLFYDNEYSDNFSNNNNNITFSELFEKWEEEPCQRLMLDSLGDVRDKKILLLGNGSSPKELLLLLKGADVVYSDISWNAIVSMKNALRENELFNNHKDRIELHSIDAMHIPFADNYFDIIYGYAFVHHLQEIKVFLSEVCRCLKPAGICRFMDDGYSPIWQGAKNTILKPLQVYSHKHKGISPEDLVATKLGGFKKEQILLWGKQLSFENILYRKSSFFEYLLNRGIEKLDLKPLKFFKPGMRKIDDLLRRKTNFISTNGIRLVWGYTKPKTTY